MDTTWFYKWSNQGLSDLQRECSPMSWGYGGADDMEDVNLYRTKYTKPDMRRALILFPVTQKLFPVVQRMFHHPQILPRSAKVVPHSATVVPP